MPRPVRVCVIENEGPPSLFQQKLAAKAASWDGADFRSNVFVYQSPWGEFSFADPDARAALADSATSTRSTSSPPTRRSASASPPPAAPTRRRQFVDWLVECGLKSTRAFWLLHHENKAGQISGDWGRHPDTKVQLQADGNRPRTKLVWEKTRWASLPTETRRRHACSSGSSRRRATPSSSSTHRRRLRLGARTANPRLPRPSTRSSTTRSVQRNVKGTNSRISALSKAKFDCVEGRGNTKLWVNPAERVAEDADAPTHSEATTDE